MEINTPAHPDLQPGVSGVTRIALSFFLDWRSLGCLRRKQG